MSTLSKRKLDDYYYATTSSSSSDHHSISPTRTRKDTYPPDPTRFQFFIRMFSDPTLLLNANPTDTIHSIHTRIHSLTGIPVMEQRLIYRGKQLQHEQTLFECGVSRDAELNLVGRMRSTGHPYAWQCMNEIVSYVMFLFKHNNVDVVDGDPNFNVNVNGYVDDYVDDINGVVGRTRQRIKCMVEDFVNKTPRNDVEQAAGYLGIFISSGAVERLVMLYVSSNGRNREAANEGVKQFVVSGGKFLSKEVYVQCGAVVLEFCKLLRRAVGSDDELYVFCRGSLGGMDVFEDGVVDGRRKVVGLEEAFPFVEELGGKLVRDLEAGSLSEPRGSDIRDIVAFSGPLMRVIKGNKAFGRMELGLVEGVLSLPAGYMEQIKYFRGVFGEMLDRVEKCLVRVEEDAVKKEERKLDYGAITWFQYLPILKLLNGIAKIYYGCEEIFWEVVRRRKGGFCHLVVKCAKRNDEFKWMLEGKGVTNFEARRHLALLMLPEVKEEFEELHEMLIDRSQLLAVSFEYIAHADTDSLRAGLFMEFKNEEATGPGVLREWFVLVCQEIFNPQNALFVACPNDRRRFFPNPASKVDKLHLEYFRFCGRVIALSLMHKIHIGIVLDRSFFMQLAGIGVLLEDIGDADPYLYNSCKQILEMDAEAVDQDALGLTFVHEIEEFGTRKVVELCDGGRSMSVDSRNRKCYVDSLIKHRFVTAIREQVENFAKGFSDIADRHRSEEFFRFLEPEDLDLMLHGSENPISVDDWKAHTNYYGFEETDPQISWFWKSVDLMTQEQKKVLLFFWTSIKYLPVEGFGGLSSRLYIYKTPEPSDHLPSSHTCFFRLCFPSYPSLSVTRDRLSIITQEHVGCSFGTW